MSAARAAHLERRRQLLELEAEVQRIALHATFTTLQERRTLVWGGTLAVLAAQLLAIPRIRWLVVATLLAKLKPKKTV